MLREKLGKVLVHVQAKHDVKTQADFALKVGISIDRVKNIMANKVKKLNTEEVRAIQATYGVRDVWWTNDKAPMLLSNHEREISPTLHSLATVTEEITALNLAEHYARQVQELVLSFRRKDGEAITRQLDRLTAQATDEHVFVPRYDVVASAGNGSYFDDECILDRMAFRIDWLAKVVGCSARHLAVIDVKGDSMLPTLKSGDSLLLDLRQDRPMVDGLYVLHLRGALLVKRLRWLMSGDVQVMSDNAIYKTEVVTGKNADNFKPIARVVWAGVLT
jgi:phage repressor protein C with HTH and peptisase S24 domain